MSDLTELESGHVFRMRSVRDVFAKPYREKRRYENAGSDNDGRKDRVDAAINFAIAAWHITDWVWQRHEHELRERFDVNSLHESRDKMRLQCPDLAVCDVIANAARHGGDARGKQERPEIETVLVAESASEGATSAELIVEPVRHSWSLKIMVDGKSRDFPALLTPV